MSGNTPIRPNFNIEQSQMTMDEKVPISPTVSEPSSPPRAYNPSEVERSSGYQTPGEPLTAVNSINLEAGLSAKAKEARDEQLEPETETEREIPTEELPVVVRPFSAKMRKHLMAQVDTDIASFPLGAYCFMTGYVSPMICYSAHSLLTSGVAHLF